MLNSLIFWIRSDVINHNKAVPIFHLRWFSQIHMNRDEWDFTHTISIHVGTTLEISLHGLEVMIYMW